MSVKNLSFITRVILITALYFLGGFLAHKSSFELDNGETISLFWPSSGIALASILFFGYRYWVGVFLGALLVSVSYLSPTLFGEGHDLKGPLFFVLGTASGNAVGAIVCAYLLHRAVQFRNSLERVRDVAGLVLFGSILGTTLNAAFTALGLCLADGAFWGERFWDTFTPAWLRWWVPNVMANLVVAPLLLTLGSDAPFQWTGRRIVEASICAVFLFAGTLLSFDSWLFYGISSYPFAYLPYPFLVWAALRFGQQGATTGTALVSTLAIYSLMHHRGPFVMSTETDSFVILGSYISIVAVSNMFLAAAATERFKAEQAVRESERRYRAVVEDQTEQIWRFRQDGTLTFVNEAYCRLAGKKREELLGQNFLPNLLPEDRDIPLAYFSALTPENPMLTYDYRVTTPEGQTCWQQCTTRAIFDEQNKILEFQTVAQDITARKRAEEELARARDAALESARIKSEFMANISHEIRTPMNGVIGMTELLSETPLSSEQKEYLETIKASGDGLLSIINDILDFSKIGSGKFKFEILDFDLRATIESTVDLLAEGAQSKGIEVVANVDEDVNTLLRGDAGRLRQVLSNLISNAIKFTEKGEVVLRVAKEKEGPNKVFLRFEVRDTGIGISEEGQGHLFQAFYQADGSTTRKYGGTGLGLAICKRLVEMMQGEIGMESKLGQGSTFWFTAWFDKQPPVSITPSPAAVISAGAKVLVIDDNESSRTSIVDMIQGRKIQNSSAGTGAEALALLRREAETGVPFSVAILDAELTDMPGLKLVQQIKSEPAIQDVKLVMMIPFRKGGESEQFRLWGVSSLVFKPVKQTQLFEAISNALYDQTPMSKAPVPTPAEPAQAKAPLLPSSAKILVAEDNVVNQKVTLSQLNRLGYKADLASNGQEALDAMQRDSYDLILMDCHMPQMDGYEATAEIRRREGQSRHTVVIALTASVLAGDREKCLSAGMDDYIGKPVKTDQLQQVLGRWLQEGNGEDPSKKQS